MRAVSGDRVVERALGKADSYPIRWTDGRESIFAPGPGARGATR